ncbi:NAD-P-binding protein [Mycena olivaceomarginata]|nr:NAD-P-binding protein [Mycena olivaceomarginata]
MPTQKTVLITGCSDGGIGSALAKEYHARGLRVFATSRRLETMEELSVAGIEALALDVTDVDAIKRTKDEISTRTGGKLDILVNNAGQTYEAAVADMDLAAARTLFELNVWAPVSMVQEFLPLLISSGRGCVVNIGSTAGILPVPLQAAYNMSKAAIHQFGYTLGVELAPFDIRVVNVLTDKAVPTDEYARGVVAETIKDKPRAWLWGGRAASLTWLLTTFFPRSIIDWIITDMYGFPKFAAQVQKEKAKKRA